jgi:diacylglycerol kinase family enzyme/membrane-associated phospholipid phosphatase
VLRVVNTLHSVIDRVRRADRALSQRSAALRPTIADPLLKALSTGADRSGLWLGAAALLATRKGRTRRAALRGAASIALVSTATNLVGKPLLPRRRPPADLVAAHRRINTPPLSSSFPSGHAASAAAFTAALAVESPLLGAVVAPVAAAVAYSRVHTGVHWPSDVLAGAALGTGAALLTRRWWPVRPGAEAVTDRPDVQLPALADGAGLLVLINPEAGDGAGEPASWAKTNWPAAHIVYADTDLLTDDLEQLVQENEPTALAVAGGDGTTAAATSVALRHHLPLAIIPAGTLNHFAKDTGLDLESVADAVSQGTGMAVGLGAVRTDGGTPKYFLNTASLGSYPDVVQLREKWEPRWGKWPAAAAALIRVLRSATPLDVTINGRRQRVWGLFVGNGRYAPSGSAPAWRPDTGNGNLDVRYVRAGRFARLRVVLSALTGTLHRSKVYTELVTGEAEVQVHGDPVAVATDGEVGPEGTRFVFTARPRAVKIYRR